MRWNVESTATHCNTLQHTATHCNTLHTITVNNAVKCRVCCNTLQHTATHCNTLYTITVELTLNLLFIISSQCNSRHASTVRTWVSCKNSQKHSFPLFLLSKTSVELTCGDFRSGCSVSVVKKKCTQHKKIYETLKNLLSWLIVAYNTQVYETCRNDKRRICMQRNLYIRRKTCKRDLCTRCKRDLCIWHACKETYIHAKRPTDTEKDLDKTPTKSLVYLRAH